MTEPIQVQDPRELVGYPRTPLRKLSRNERAAVKKLLLETLHNIDPVMAVRMALSSGVPVRPEWLQAGQIDLALETEDILRNLHKLTISKRIINATQVIGVLSKRAGRAPSLVLRVLGKLTQPGDGTGDPMARTMLDRDTALQTIRLATALIPLLCRRQTVKSKKPVPQALVEIVFHAAESWPVLEVAIKGLEFLRVIDRDVSWIEIEKPPIERMRHSLLRLPTVIIQELLERGALVEATLLGEEAKLYVPAEKMLRTAVAETITKQIPLASKNWAARFLQPEGEHDSASPIGGDAAYERLALVLINAWEARGDGENAAHAFSVCEEIFRNGFNIHLCGEVGSSVTFDSDVHVSNDHLLPGAKGRVMRPWIELETTNETRILIKGRVAASS